MESWTTRRILDVDVAFLADVPITHHAVAGGGLWTQKTDAVQLTFSYGRFASLESWREQITADRPAQFGDVEACVDGHLQRAVLPEQPPMHLYLVDGRTDWVRYPTATAVARRFTVGTSDYLVDWTASYEIGAAAGQSFIDQFATALLSPPTR